MTQDQTNALENLSRASARLRAARAELTEAMRDHAIALTKAREKSPDVFYSTTSAEMDLDDD